MAYRYTPPLFNLQPGVLEYAYNKPTNTEVHGVFAALVNGNPLALMNTEEAIAAYPQWADKYSGESSSVLWSETQSGAIGAEAYNEGTFNSAHDFVVPDSIVADAATPACLTQITPDKYIILPLPDDADTYEMRMFLALKPARDATAMDSAAFNELEDCIFHKALHDLLLIPKVDWSDPNLAGYHGRQYGYKTAERRARANLGNMRGQLRVQLPYFA